MDYLEDSEHRGKSSKYNMDEMEYVRLLPFENETMRKIGISEYSIKIIKPSACKADVRKRLIKSAESKKIGVE